MTPVRVLLVAPSLDIVGGQAVQANRLLEWLGAEPSVTIAFQPVNPRLPGPLRMLQRLKYVRTAVTSAAYLTMLTARAWRYDVLHVFAAGYTSFALAPTPAILMGKLFRRKVILNYRDGRAEDHLTKWPSAVWTMRLVDEIIAPSGFLPQVFARFGLRARWIYNIIDTSRFRYRERRVLRPAFLHNRGLEPVYDVECTLRAFAIVQRRYPEASLTVAHDGPLRQRLESLAAELGLRKVRFTGRVSQQETPGVYDAADIYLTSPRIDNMPGSLLECFASGVPVVASRAGGIPWIVEDGRTGLLFDAGDHEQMARCALRLLETGDLGWQLAANARKECEKYSGAAVAAEWVKLYRELAGSRGADVSGSRMKRNARSA